MFTLFDMGRRPVNPALVNETLIAVDFGKLGGFAWNRNGKLYSMAMPDALDDINLFLRELRPPKMIGEDVHPFPDQGAVSVGTLMEGKGEIRGLCKAYNIRLELTSPQSWMNWYQFDKKSSDFKDFRGQKDKPAWKRYLRDKAQALFPEQKVTLKTADALLIWNWYLNPERVREIPALKAR